MRKSRRRGVLRIAGLALLVTAAGQVASYGADSPWPGVRAANFPDPNGLNVWGSVQTTGVSEVARARQWTRIPLQASLIETLVTAASYYPADDPERRSYRERTWVNIYWSSPAGAKHGYGESLPFTVRTVAFGSVPVEAMVQLAQVRDKDDLPVPFQLRVDLNYFTPDSGRWTEASIEPTQLDSQVSVRVLGLSVDGLKIPLATPCHTTTPAALELQGAGATIQKSIIDGTDAEKLATSYDLASHGVFASGLGGALNGTVDVPTFAPCRTTAGEDIAPLLTAAVSGPGNPVTVSSPPFGSKNSCWTRVSQFVVKPRAPFQGDPSVECDPDMKPWPPPMPSRP